MKPYQIAVFIMVTMAVVVLLAFVYPKEGIEVGGVTLKFADAEEVLAPDEEPAYDASGDADKIRRYIAAQQMNEEREAEEAEEVVSTSDEEDSGTEDKEPEDGEAESEKE